MTTDEIYRIVVQVEGDAKVASLTNELRQEEVALKSLLMTLRNYSNVADLAPVQAATARISALKGQLASTEVVAKKFGGLGGDMANKMMVFGQTLDDLQYVPEMGLRPIMNNLMQMSPIVGTVVLAGYVLYQQWDNLGKLFGSGKTESEAEEMERLGKATRRTADEEERYQQLRQTAGAAKAQAEGIPEADKKRMQAVNEAIIEAGTPDVRRGVIGALTAMNPEKAKLEAELARNLEIQKTPQNETRTAALIEQENRLRAKLSTMGMSIEDEATSLMAETGANPERRGTQLMDMVRANSHLFGGKKAAAKLADDLENALSGVGPKEAEAEQDRKDAADQAESAKRLKARKEREKKEKSEYQRTLIESADKDEEENVKNYDEQVLKPQFEEAKDLWDMVKGLNEKDKKAQEKADDLLIRDVLGEDKKQRKRTSEVVDLADFSSKIQSGVGGEKDPSLVELKEIKDLLKKQLEDERRKGLPVGRFAK